MPATIKRHLSLRTLLIGCIVLGIIAILLFYVLFQARLLIAGPTIDIVDVPVRQYDGTVEIEGTAHNIISLTLNGRPVYTNDSGHFAETLVLPEGYTIMTLRAKDRYGREAVLERSFVYSPRT